MSKILRESSPERKRRSTRVAQALPIIVQGEDSTGQSFKEHTFTVSINCYGCRFQSKHQIVKNSRVTLQIPHRVTGNPPCVVQGRIAWVTPPRSAHEHYQVGVELDIPGNIWGMAFPPEDWFPYPETAPSGASNSNPSASGKFTGDALDRPANPARQSPVPGPALVANDLNIADAVQSLAKSPVPQELPPDPAECITAILENAARDIRAEVDAAIGRLDQQSASLAAALRESLGRMNAEAENALGAVCSTLDAEMNQARALLAELKARSEAIQETSAKFDALRRTATEELKWHEKRIENQVHLAMEKAAEQTGRTLNEKAAELTSRFTAQLEHFSRTYVEHTQSQLEETSRNVSVRSREVIQQMVESAASNVRLETQRAAESLNSAGNTQARAAAEETAIVEFNKRLENAANTWLVTTVSILEDRTQKTFEAIFKTIEERLRGSGPR